MYPNLFVIGAAKSGTTSLHHYLSQHPDVHMSKEKEPNFFSASDHWPQHSIRDRARYEALFDTDRPVGGESSVTYSYWPYPSGVPERIHAVAPDAKLIYLVRDPVERVISHYRHRVGLGEEHRSLQEVVEEPNEPEERYLAASMYATQVERYLEHFPQESLLVLDHARMRSDRNGLLRECVRFLGVDESFVPSEWERELNDTASQRRYGALANRIRHSSAYRRTLDWGSPELRQRVVGPVRKLLTRKVQRDDVVTDEIRQHYAALLAPEAARLRALTGLPFDSWSV